MDITRKIKANPTPLNAAQPYVKKYDALAEIANQTAQVSNSMLMQYARAKDYANQEETNRNIADYKYKVQDLTRKILLSQDHSSYEENLNEEIRRLDEDYQDKVPQKYRARFDTYAKMAKDEALLDIRYGGTKTALTQANESLTYSVTKLAESTIGKSNHEISLTNAMVYEQVNEAFNEGRITPTEKEKLIDTYQRTQKSSNMKHLILTTPEVAEEILKTNAWGFEQTDLDEFNVSVQNELDKRQVKADIQRQALDEANIMTALDFISQQKEIPQATLEQLTSPVRAAFQKRQLFALKGEDVATDVNLYDHLRVMARNNPDKFKNLNLYEYIGDLSVPDLNTLKHIQSGITIDSQGKARLSEVIKFDTDLKNMAYHRMGYTNKDAEKKYYFNQMYEDAAREKIQQLGRALTSNEKEDIVNELTKEVAIRHSWSKKVNAELTDDDFEGEDRPYDDTFKKTRRFESGQVAAAVEGMTSYGINVEDLTVEERIEWIENLTAAYQSPVANRQARVQKTLEALAQYLRNKG